MARSHRSVTLLALALVAAPAVLSAQGTTTSALGGLVRDPAGQPAAGVTIRVSSSALIGGERVTRSTENGSYRFPLLPPGKYRIVVEAQGFSTLVGSEVLELGRTSTVNWKLQKEAATTVEVVSTATSTDEAPITLTQNYNTEDIAALPADRSLDGIMNLTPGVNGSQAWGGNAKENAYMMDGMNISDPSGNTPWIFPNIDWFSEVQVGGLGASAEYGGFAGSYVNGVLKRGGNEVEGSLNAYYSNSSWQARTSNTDIRLTNDDKVIPPSKNWDLAMSIGGALVKDRLWYFCSMERLQEEDTPIGAMVPKRNQKLMGLAKVTWQASQSSTLEVLAEYDYVGRDRRGIDRITLPVATVKETAPNRSISLTWNQVFGSDKVLTVKAFGYSGRYDLQSYNGEAPPLDTLDPWNGIEFYNAPQNVDWNYRSRANITATFDLFKSGLISAEDSHAFRFGIEREQAADEELERYPGGANLNGGWDDGGVYTDFFITGGGWNIRQRVDRTAAFAMDTWTINDRLTLRPGIRFEQFKARFYGAETLWNKSTWAPRFGLTFAVTKDQKNMLKAHWGRYYAGYSTYFIDRAIQSAIPVRTYYSWGAPADDYAYTYIDPYNPSTWPAWDTNDPNNPPYRRINDLTTVDPDAKQPYTEETTVSFEHKFAKLWTLAGSWVYRQYKDQLIQKDLAPDPDGVWTEYVNPIDNGPVWVYEPGLYGDQHQYIATTGGEDAKRRYWAWTLSLERRMENHWSLNASYTRARSSGNIIRGDSYDKTFSNPNGGTNADGRLPGYNDDEVKIRAIYEFPWNMRLSGTYTYLSGEHWTPQYRTPRYDGTRYYINTETRGNQEYPSRSLLDFRLSQFFNLSKKSKLEIFLEAFNLLNSGSTTDLETRINGDVFTRQELIDDPTLVNPVYDYYKIPYYVQTSRRLQVGLRVTF